MRGVIGMGGERGAHALVELACNPALAYQAIQAVEDIGLLLPCNVLVREDNAGVVHVDFMDPQSVLSLVDDPGVDAMHLTQDLLGLG